MKVSNHSEISVVRLGDVSLGKILEFGSVTPTKKAEPRDPWLKPQSGKQTQEDSDARCPASLASP